MELFLIVLGIALLIIFALPIFEKILNFGNFAGISAGLCLLFLGVYGKRLPEMIYKTAVISALFAVAFCVILIIFIALAGKTKAKNEKVIIVLGCRVKGDRASLALLKRVDSAEEFLRKNPESTAILSGGQGRDEKISEALCMKRILTERGIDEARLIMEDKSTSTDENIRFSLEIMEKTGAKKEAAIATSEYHQLRAGIICKRYSLKAAPVSSKTRADLKPTFYLREVFAVFKELMVNAFYKNE